MSLKTNIKTKIRLKSFPKILNLFRNVTTFCQLLCVMSYNNKRKKMKERTEQKLFLDHLKLYSVSCIHLITYLYASQAN